MVRYEDTVNRVDIDVPLIGAELESVNLHERAFDSLKWEESCIRTL